MRAAVLALAASAAFLAGCGSETATSPTAPDEGVSSVEPTEASATPTAQPAAQPSCAEVWQEGAKLSANYSGCSGMGAAAAQAQGIYCESGQMIYTHAQFYAAAGRKIIKADGPLKKDADYQAALKTCRG